MPFVKVVKSNVYFKRFQVKFRRRRECKTDYKQRRALLVQDKNKYNAPKYRLVVRLSNTQVTCQIVYATLRSDVVMAAAYSHELPRYGAAISSRGIKNYAAAYATGLLVARRVLKKIGLDTQYIGQTNVDGKDFLVQKPEDATRRPFYVILDRGLHRGTTGARIFGAMKGAADGGLDIPHKNRRFPGYNEEKKKFDSRVLRKHIFGGHVADYMRKLQTENPEQYNKQFSTYVAAGKGPDDIEKMWATVHANIRKDPTHVKKVRQGEPKKVRKNLKKLTLAERKNRIKEKLAATATITA